jgi:hypothetical protein
MPNTYVAARRASGSFHDLTRGRPLYFVLAFFIQLQDGDACEYEATVVQALEERLLLKASNLSLVTRPAQGYLCNSRTLTKVSSNQRRISGGTKYTIRATARELSVSCQTMLVIILLPFQPCLASLLDANPCQFRRRPHGWVAFKFSTPLSYHHRLDHMTVPFCSSPD